MKSSRSLRIFTGILFLSLYSNFAQAMDVVFLTPAGSTVLMSWFPDGVTALASKNGEISAQKLIFDESTKNMDLNKRADIDLVTLYGDHGIARVPRFLIWRGFFKLHWDKKNKVLNSSVTSASRLLVPPEAFKITNIKKIELAQHSWIYPGTELKLRTNPAASRGEKLFTQSCLACHSLPNAKVLSPANLTSENLGHFTAQHRGSNYDFHGIELDAKAIRGLVAYSQALASEKNEVKSAK